MAANELPKIRAGMGDVASPAVEAWSDDDYARATGLQVILAADGKADRAGVPALAPEVLRDVLPGDAAPSRARRARARARRTATRRDLSPGTRGYEAGIVGAVAALQPDDVVVPGPARGSARRYGAATPSRRWRPAVRCRARWACCPVRRTGRLSCRTRPGSRGR